MNTSSDYHQPVLEALCAFVRSGTIGMIVSDQGQASTFRRHLRWSRDASQERE